jgi:hypothetical protein
MSISASSPWRSASVDLRADGVVETILNGLKCDGIVWFSHANEANVISLSTAIASRYASSTSSSSGNGTAALATPMSSTRVDEKSPTLPVALSSSLSMTRIRENSKLSPTEHIGYSTLVCICL